MLDFMNPARPGRRPGGGAR